VARALLRKRLGEIGQGRLIGPSAERVLVTELLNDLLTDYRITGRASLRTVTAHVEALRVHLEHVRAVDVTTPRLRRIIQAWQADGVASATINKRFTTLRRAFRLAHQSDPPKVGIVPKFPRLPEHNAREGFFDKGDFFAVLASLPDDGLRDFVEWAYWTGQRKGEIAKLTWAAFDAQTLTLTLPGRITKNGKPKKIALTGRFRAIIERRLAVRRLDCPFIFWRLHTGKPTKRLQPGQPAPIYEFRKAWRTACKAVGLDGKLFHDLRRTAVRNLRRAGVDRRVAMKPGGHRTESVFERYNIDTDDDLRDAAEKLSTYVEQLPTDRKVVPLPARTA